MPGLDWLTARPVAHRGLHDRENGIIENSESAVRAAVEAGFAIEVDIQETSDGEAVVYHDFHLDRLTDQTGRLDAQPLSVLEQIQIKGGTDRIISLQRLLEIVDGKVPLVVEIKSAETGSVRLAQTFCRRIEGYKGPIAGMSFDPQMVETLRRERPFLTRGLISYAYEDDESEHLSLAVRLGRRLLLPVVTCSPHFIAYGQADLPAIGPWVARRLLGMPVLSWTVRSRDVARRIAPYVDQIIFEGFRPDAA
ncbi:MAG: glycerophosphodiester phosphodiesterase [Rhodobiaceae bacterium]|nr:glycerophosphodiester phosphodiesterase [Rhodobiaceae bacterium]